MSLSIIWSALAAALFLVPGVARAQAGERLTDKDVKNLIESVDNARDRFEDQLEGKVKNGIARSATGEISVKDALDDFQKETERLKSRFSEKYAASAEVEAVLRRAMSLDAMMRSQPSGTKGASDWDRLVSELRRLAAVYRTSFPLPPDAVVRRINDDEAAATARLIVQQAENLKRGVDNDKSLPKAEKDALKKEVEDVIKQAKTLESRLSDSKPATADARALSERIASLTKEGRQLPSSLLTPIGVLRAPLDKLNQAFGLKPPTT